MFVRQTEPFARGIDIFRAGFAVRFKSSLDLGDAFADQRVRDDELRLAVVALFRGVERIEKLPACPGR